MSGLSPPTNFVTLLTPPGVAAIATIRLVGPRVDAFAREHLSRPLKTDRCVHAELRDGERVIDDLVAVQMNPYTLDLSVHGGAWVMQATLELAKRFGFEERAWNDPSLASFIDTSTPADAGNVGRADDVLEHEMQIALPQALTAEALALLLSQPIAWRTMLDRGDRAAIERAVSDRSLVHLLNPPTVAIVGAPNVGKSTLANQLFGRDHTITADMPGTTRDWVGAQANLDGLVVTLIDTPGVRETDDAIEREAIDRARPVIHAADLVVHVLDVTQPLDDQIADEPVGSAVRTARAGDTTEERSARRTLQRNVITVVNKVDQPPAWDVANEPHGLPVCARTGDGVNALRQAIRQLFGCTDLTSLHARCWTDRQRGSLQRALVN